MTARTDLDNALVSLSAGISAHVEALKAARCAAAAVTHSVDVDAAVAKVTAETEAYLATVAAKLGELSGLLSVSVAPEAPVVTPAAPVAPEAPVLPVVAPEAPVAPVEAPVAVVEAPVVAAAPAASADALPLPTFLAPPADPVVAPAAPAAPEAPKDEMAAALFAMRGY